jgi:ABC-type branched-subunit amino acid transport system substrate-binding protein
MLRRASGAQKPIKVGFPMILSGPGALFGEPALKGAPMCVEELNAKGGVLGRRIEPVPRDTKGNADEAVRTWPAGAVVPRPARRPSPSSGCSTCSRSSAG